MRKGFTLIELLVVISIISLLASVVLASLSSARAKAADAAVKADLESARSQAALFYDKYKNYGEISTGSHDCDTNSDNTQIFGSTEGVARQVTAAFNAANAPFANGICFASMGANPSYVIAVPLKSNPRIYWCVDSSGNSKCLSGLTCEEENTVFELPTDGVTPASCDSSSF